jgi:hypothetical protein
MASLNVEPPPVRYNVDTLLLTHDNSLDGDVREELKIRHDYTTGEIDANDVIHKPPQPRVIKLRQKRKKVRVTGRFRTSNPSVNTVCRVIEGHDFDQTDLFPLGKI